MNLLKKYYLLLVIIVIAAFFRLYRLDNVPPSPSLDEVSIGYNAYSIVKTGKDEYGNFLPVLLRAYDDWRPALYVYFVVPFIKLLGINVLAVRLPAAILSTITVIFVYLLTRELFNHKKFEFSIGRRSIDLSLLTTALFAISPWHIYISRLGHEANLGFSFFMFALYFFFAYLNHKERTYALILSSLFFSLTFYTYQSFKVITPLFLLILFLLYLRELIKRKVLLILTFVLFIIVTLPILYVSFTPGALSRVNGTSVFVNNSLYSVTDAAWLKARENGDWRGTLLFNPRVTTARIFISNYLAHFDLNWFFKGAPTEQFKIPGLGLFYIWEAPLLLLGFIYLFKSKLGTRISILILFWLFSGPLPAAFATGTPHAMRSLSDLPAPQFLSLLGLFWLTAKFKIYSKLLLGVWLFVFILSIFYLSHQYFEVLPRAQSQAYQYGLNQAIPYILSLESNYNSIIVSSEKNLSQSYMFYLYWSKYDPATYHAKGGTPSGGFAQIHVIGKYAFRPIHWQDERFSPKTLYVGNPDDFPAGAGFLKKFTSLDGTPAVELYSLN